MKILLCSPSAIDPQLGAPRVLLGVAHGLTALGWECRIVGSDEVRRDVGSEDAEEIDYAEDLHRYLKKVSAHYDVIDYPYDFLPFPRSEFSSRPLFVARSVILAYHFAELRIPEVFLPRQKLRRWLTGEPARHRKEFGRLLQNARATMDNADLINVANIDDHSALVGNGVPAEKIVVIPYGLFPEEMRALSSANRSRPTIPRVCFVGTFDHRKGGADLPRLFVEICERVPACGFRLIGTAGLHQTETRVRSFFPRWIREKIEVVPRFQRDALAGLLDDCSVGVFPSYVEGFGLGALEMMAAGIPVIAYRSPGPTMMLGKDFLSPRGNARKMAAHAIRLLTDETVRQQSAEECRRRAQEFSWENASVKTNEIYRRHIGQRAMV